jgi:hypothetical protein
MRGRFPRGARRSWRWLRLVTYYVSILLVLSFICCEVLDLDGSDFPVPSKSPRLKLAESNDQRRATLFSVQPWEAMPSTAVDDHMPVMKPGDIHAKRPVRVSVIPRSRLTLPRAALDDPAA